MTIDRPVDGHVLPALQRSRAEPAQPRRSSAAALAIALARPLQWLDRMNNTARSEVRLVDLKLFWVEVSGRSTDTLQGIVTGLALFGLPGSAVLVVACSLVNLAFGRGAF